MSEQQLENQYVKVGTLRTRLRVLGKGKPTVILLHGLGGYLENWEDNIGALAQDHRVFALDLVGFGLSDKPRVRYTIPYLTEFLRDFMVVQNIESAVLIGESMGGAIALRLSWKYPNMVEKMVLAASAGIGKDGSIFLRVMSIPILGEILSRPSRKGTAQLLTEYFYNQNLIIDEWIEEDFEMSSQPGAQRCLLSALRYMCNIWGGRREAYQHNLDHLNEIEVPTLVIWGAQDRILPVAHAHQAANGLLNAQLHIFESCGHVPNVECAEEFNALVKDFLSNG